MVALLFDRLFYMTGIYKITSPSNKVYIGQSVNINKRWRQHRNYISDNSRLYNSFDKYGVENHKFEVIEECSVEKLNERERYWQEYYDVIGKNGLNLKLTKTKDKSGHLNNDVKLKISKSKIGKKLSDEVVEKIKKRMNENHPMKNKKHSYETRLKISKSNKGNVFTKEASIKRKESIKNRCPVYHMLCIMNLKDGLKKVKRSKEWNDNISKGLKGIKKDSYTRIKISNTLKGKMTGAKNGNSKSVLDLETGIYYDTVSDCFNSTSLSRTKFQSKYRGIRYISI